jgi:hypothetical protein
VPVVRSHTPLSVSAVWQLRGAQPVAVSVQGAPLRAELPVAVSVERQVLTARVPVAVRAYGDPLRSHTLVLSTVAPFVSRGVRRSRRRVGDSTS